MLSVVVSLSVTLYSYRKKGLSRQFRKLLMKRHISFCMLTTVCQVVQLLDFLHTSFLITLPNWLEIFCIYYFVLSSVLYSLVRLTEPVVLAAFKKSVSRVFCCSNSESRSKQVSNKPSNGSLTISNSSRLTEGSSFTAPMSS